MNKDAINVEGVQIGVPAASDIIVSLTPNTLLIHTLITYILKIEYG